MTKPTYDLSNLTHIQWMTTCKTCGPLVARAPRPIGSGFEVSGLLLGAAICGRCGSPAREEFIRMAVVGSMRLHEPQEEP